MRLKELTQQCERSYEDSLLGLRMLLVIGFVRCVHSRITSLNCSCCAVKLAQATVDHAFARRWPCLQGNTPQGRQERPKDELPGHPRVRSRCYVPSALSHDLLARLWIQAEYNQIFEPRDGNLMKLGVREILGVNISIGKVWNFSHKYTSLSTSSRLRTGSDMRRRASETRGNGVGGVVGR
ncbi:hypothetical protein HYQ46_011166 [Verticillium longisporum]|nr:hypothetical protein HYQ46_011166 [Verticillium longisporum]